MSRTISRDRESRGSFRGAAKLDTLMGVIRLEFIPAFPNGLAIRYRSAVWRQAKRSVYARCQTRQYPACILHRRSLNWTTPSIASPEHIRVSSRHAGGYPCVAKVNAVDATVMGVDATATSYIAHRVRFRKPFRFPPCPTQTGDASLQSVLDNGNLYVLDAPHGGLGFVGKDGAFVDTPYFILAIKSPTSRTPSIWHQRRRHILLHSDGHLSTCTFSRLSEAPTRCQDPAPHVDNYPAHQNPTFSSWHTLHKCPSPTHPIRLCFCSILKTRHLPIVAVFV